MSNKKEVPYGIENGNILIYKEFIDKVFYGDVNLCLEVFQAFIGALESNKEIKCAYDVNENCTNIKVIYE